MFYADILGFAGITGTVLGKIDTVAEALFFIVCFLWLVARFVFYVIQKTQAVRREAWDQKQREKTSQTFMNGKHQHR